MDFEVIPKSARFDDTVLITGFHGIGYVGYWTVKYLIQKLEAKRVAFIDSDSVSPVASTNQGKLVTPYEFYQSKDITLFKVEVPPYRGAELDFYRSFSKWVTESKFREVVLIGGLDSSLRTDDSSFRLVHTNSYVPNEFVKVAKILEDEQIIVGPVAIMLNYFESRNFPAYAVLSYSSTDRIDPRAAVASIEILSKCYGFTVDVEPLMKGAEAVETEVSKQERKLGKTESIYT
ncbi:MAG: proteasome assembly chaperone family protein [Nitrososphaerota archaeon]|nr:proteasome assembly chaperone family protein [Nitrososphaerota archaeon]MDG6924128.1 proteasome assembly chaperone family protein [Nitrososphaerota archaeon]